MKNKYSSVLDLSATMKYVVSSCGVIMPNLETRLAYPKITLKILKSFGKVTCFLLFCYFAFNSYSFAVSLSDGTAFQDALFYAVVAVNACCCVHRAASIISWKETISEFFNQFTRNFQNKILCGFRQELVHDKMKIINVVAITFITVQVVFTYILNTVTAIQFGKELHPNKMPGDRNNPLVVAFYVSFEIISAACYVTSMTSFEWVLLTYVRLTTVELMVIRKQINCIFSILVWNDDHGICVTTQNIEYGMDGVDNSRKNANRGSYTPVNCNQSRDRYRKVLKFADMYLDEVINHHSRIYADMRKAKSVFGSTIVMTYLNTVFLSFSWILTLGQEEDSPEGNAVLLQPFSVMAFTMLAYLSYFGEELVKAGKETAYDVMGFDWYLYPVSMKKKLNFFLYMSQKPIKLDFLGQGPLCYESFKMSCQCCYSLFTFLQGSHYRL